MSYAEQLTKAMNLLAEDERVIFIGQNVIYSGAVAIHDTLSAIPLSQKLELPVFEDTQLGLSIGLSLEGYIPVSIFPRMDFLIVAANQLVNHLDKIEAMSCGRFKPKVIIRCGIGGTKPLNPGPQHSQNHVAALQCLLTNIEVITLFRAGDIVPAYKDALASSKSTILVEWL